jgi:hypothetical protein
MKNLRDTCIDFFTDENLKKDVREMMKPIFSMIYNEMYIYIWLIAFYNLFIMILVLAMFFILCKLLRSYEAKRSILAQFEMPINL